MCFAVQSRSTSGIAVQLVEQMGSGPMNLVVEGAQTCWLSLVLVVRSGQIDLWTFVGFVDPDLLSSSGELLVGAGLARVGLAGPI